MFCARLFFFYKTVRPNLSHQLFSAEHMPAVLQPGTSNVSKAFGVSRQGPTFAQQDAFSDVYSKEGEHIKRLEHGWASLSELFEQTLRRTSERLIRPIVGARIVGRG